jgi:hypothetical protein
MARGRGAGPPKHQLTRIGRSYFAPGETDASDGAYKLVKACGRIWPEAAPEGLDPDTHGHAAVPVRRRQTLIGA